MAIPSENGKIAAVDVDNYIMAFYQDDNHGHMIFPGMVYISYPTEYGTIYSRKELEVLSRICQKHHVPLYLDGARLGYGLMSEEADLTIADIARLCDVFYIGGTKVGDLFGEAVVLTQNNEPKHFTTLIKRHGALLAKGRLLGVQFLELFTNNLYFEISHLAVKLAMKMKVDFLEKGYQLYIDSPNNQQFFVLSNDKLAELEAKVHFAFWERYDDRHSFVRFATS